MKNMTLAFGKPICVGLYTAFAFLAMKKKPLPLLTLLAMHASEYFLIGKKVAEEHGISTPEALAQCLSFGFTWWLPIKNEW